MNPRKVKNSIPVLFLIILSNLTGCKESIKTDLTVNDIIPAPISVVATNTAYVLQDKATITINDQSLSNSAEALKGILSTATGYGVSIETSEDAAQSGFSLTVAPGNTEIGKEGYVLDISEDLVQITANSPAGVFWGIQTIRQLLPAQIESKEIVSGTQWIIPTGKIVDYPTYGYRGSMLDVARHFFNIDQVKQYIDYLAGLKMNVLHLHLSDDQGWRIEIKSWPKLTEVGGQSEVGGDVGGYYTQEQYKDLVQYAADRFITIVPEIDMPGHTHAALVSYPELNCHGLTPQQIGNKDIPKPNELYTGTEVGFSTLCTDDEKVLKFVDDVAREMAALTPGPYLHMGGDESHVTRIEDYIPFFNKVQKIVTKYGKQMVGWDEVAHAELDEGTVVQFWDKVDNTVMGVEKGAKVIMSPAKRAYLDMKYDSTSRLGLSWAAYIEVDDAYQWDPSTYEEKIGRDVIVGIEAPLWSETIDSMDDIEYLLFPRIMGYAEIGWTPAAQRDWEQYKVRLGNQANRLKTMGIDYYPSSKVPWTDLAN